MTSLNPPHGDESVPELVRLVADEIRAHGPVTFARFMELVVAHPRWGYYATSRDRPGFSGDFLTAPEMHPIFGSVLARQVLEMWAAIGQPAELIVREYGAGSGTLARQIMAALAGSGAHGLSQVRYQLVDIADGDTTPGEELGPFRGVVLANEFLDALPFHRLVVEGGEVREIYTAFRDGWLADEIGPVSDEARTALPALGQLAEGQRFEVSPGQREWVLRLAGELEQGFALLIDYGYPRAILLDAERFPDGTLKTYRAHEVGVNPYIHLGRQDITAHVDFTVIEETAKAAGLVVAGLTTQAEFVSGLGIERDLADVLEAARSPDEYIAARSAVMSLVDPGGLGRFRVLVLAKDVDEAVELSGLRFRHPGLSG